MTMQNKTLKKLEAQLEEIKSTTNDSNEIATVTKKILKIKNDQKKAHSVNLFNIHTRRDFQLYLVKNLRIMFSSCDDNIHGAGTFIVTDKVHNLNLNDHLITYEDDDYNLIKVEFYDFLILDSDDVVLFTKTQAIVKLWSTLKL